VKFSGAVRAIRQTSNPLERICKFEYWDFAIAFLGILGLSLVLWHFIKK
jgi:hypothetical protein